MGRVPAHLLTTAEPARWYQAGVRLRDGAPQERVLASALGPRLDQLAGTGAAAGWWFIRKPPGLRVRLLDADPGETSRLLDELTAAQVIAQWTTGIYEPETAAFGGLAGTDAVHALFLADTQGITQFLRRDPPAGRRELSLQLVGTMLAAAGLDWFERGDVLAKVAALRPAPPAGSAPRLSYLSQQARLLLTVPASVPATSGSCAVPGPAWAEGFAQAGTRLAAASSEGSLTRGLRAVLAHAVIFHWNRLGLPAATQGILATAGRDAFLPPH
jgi:thiopeptide-type bacteriocin biosynthesis protein